MRAQRLDRTEEGIAVEGNFNRTKGRFEAAYEEDAQKLLEEYEWVNRVWDKSLLGLIKEEDKCINSGDTVSLGL